MDIEPGRRDEACAAVAVAMTAQVAKHRAAADAARAAGDEEAAVGQEIVALFAESLSFDTHRMLHGKRPSAVKRMRPLLEYAGGEPFEPAW